MSEQVKSSWESRFSATLLSVFISLAIAAYLIPDIVNSNFFAHLTFGNWILSNAELPRQDFWTVAGEGKNWIATNWLFELLLALIESLSFQKGFILLILFVNCFLVALLSFLFSKESKSIFFGTIISLVVSCGVLLELPISPLLFGLIGFVLLLIFLNREGSKKNLFGVFLVSLLLANSTEWHLFVLLSVLFLHTRRLVVSDLIALFTPVLITPFFGGQVIALFKGLYTELPYRTSVLIEAGTVYQFKAGFSFVLGLVLLVFFFHARKGLRSNELVGLGIMFFLSMAFKIVFPFYLIALGLGLSRIWGRTEGGVSAESEENSLGELGKGIHQLKQWTQRFDPPYVAFFFACLVVVNFVRTYKMPDPMIHPAVRMVDRYMEEETKSRIIHGPDLGDYLVYRFQNEPSKKALLDSRVGRLNSEVFKASAFYKELIDGGESLEKIANPTHLMCNSIRPTCQRFLHDASWGLLYPELSRKEAGGWILMRRKSQ